MIGGAKRGIVIAAVLAVCGVFAATPGRNEVVWQVLADPPLYAQTAERMRTEHTDYYRAMSDEMKSWLDDVPASTRAFRLPTIFLLWRVLPHDRAIWWLYVAFVACLALLIMALSREPLIAIGVAAYLLLNGYNTYTVVEYWSLPFVAGTFLAWRRGAHRASAGLALVAFLIRELTAPLLIGGLIASRARRGSVVPWLAGIVVAAAAVLLHAQRTAPYLAPAGTGGEAPLLFTGGPGSVLAMMGVGLSPGTPQLWPQLAPIALVVGATLWVAAVVRVWRDDALRWIALPYLALPWVGLIAHRPYWGYLVVPFTMAWGSEQIAAWVRVAMKTAGARRVASSTA